jgi:uncharacterized SAM-binding protein YcdF (DUF218 family)
VQEINRKAGPQTMRYGTRIVRRIAVAVLTILAVSGSILFLQFTSQIENLSTAGERASADAIVVLTGDRARIAKAIELLRAGKGERLLISGVNERTSRAAIRNMVANADTRFDCCVDIDRAALDTIGNARQAGIWARNRGFRSLIIVTSDYHLPRSLVEFRRAMPGVTVYPVSANSDAENAADSSRDRLRTLALEFFKYIAARLHLGTRQGSGATEVAETPSR